MSDGVMKMRKMDRGLEIKPGQTVELKPGGYHLMFNGLREGLKQGQTIKGTLQFANAGSVAVEFQVAREGSTNWWKHANAALSSQWRISRSKGLIASTRQRGCRRHPARQSRQ